MVGVTCEKCGASYRFDDADVPPSGKIIKCARCGSSVTVMPTGAAAMGMKAESSGKKLVPPPLTPGAAAKTAAGPPAEKDAWDNLSSPDLLLSKLDDSGFDGGPDIASIPVPKRASPLAAAQPVVPAPSAKKESPLATLGGKGEDLLAPVGPTSKKGPLADLPAPVGPTSKKGPLADLPAPVGPTGTKQVPDLPAPVGPTSTKHGADLLTPVGPTSRRGDADTDLPAPVGPVSTRQLPDLLTPVGPTGRGGTDLTPVGPTGRGGTDLTPVGPTGRGATDLPAPKGFFEDGLQPKANPKGATDLPAPKGFFEDGLQPAGPSKTAPPTRPSAPIAPATPPSSGEIDLPIDLMSYEDLGPSAMPGAQPAPKAGLDLGDPFDLGDPLGPAGSAPSRPFGLDADDMELTTERAGASGDLAPTVPLELDDGPLGDADLLSLDGPSPIELDLPSPQPPSEKAITFAKPKASTMAAAAAPAPARGKGRDDPFAPSRGTSKETQELGLDLDRTAPPGTQVKTPAAAKKRVAKADAKPKKNKRVLVLVAVLGVAAVGAGGYFAYDKWQGQKTRKGSAERGLKKAEKLLADDAPGHWEKAAAEAERVLKGDPANTEALALVAEANFAAALDESPDAPERIAKGDEAIEKLQTKQAKGPHASKAEALRAILSTSFDSAIKRLEKAKDADAKLYLGWALDAREQHAAAVAAYDASLKKNPKRIPALYGLGLAQIELGAYEEARKAFQAAIDNSRDRYKRDHLGALIGLARLAEVGERESRYQELLSRPDLAQAPRRAVSRLRALAADEAQRAGRLDQARVLYDEARVLDQLNLRAVVGLAQLAARSGDLPAARKRLTSEVLEVAPDHIEASLALADVALAEGKMPEALQLADALFARQPPIGNPQLVARAHVVRGRTYEANADRAVQEKAEAEYREAMKRADPGDFAAAVRLSTLLGKLGRGKEASEILAPVKQAASKDPDLAITLGGAYMAAGNGDLAIEAFQAALAKRPDDVEARYQLGQALAQLGKRDEAISTLEKAFQADASREDVGLALARTLEARGRTTDAAAVFDKMLGSKKDVSIAVRARAGRFFARAGMAEKAAAQATAIQAENPKYPAGLFLLGEQLYMEKKYDEALKVYREASRLENEAQYFEGLGRTAEALEQYDEALRDYAKAIEIDAAYLRPRVGRARLRIIRREYAQAVEELNAAREVAPDDSTVIAYLGRAHLAMRDLKTAMPLLERAVKLNGSNADAHYYLGTAHAQLERSREAAAHLGRATELGSAAFPWWADAHRELGMAARAINSNALAIKAFRAYLEIDTKPTPQRRDIERLLMRLEAGQ